MNPKLTDLAIKTAEDENIPFQLAVRRGGGTDAGEMHLSETGIPCVVLGVPARYIHSHNSIIDLADYKAMVNLSLALVRRLNSREVSNLIQYL